MAERDRLARTLTEREQDRKGLLEELAARYENAELTHEKKDVIWVCWLQGMENAPEIVKICTQKTTWP